MIFSRIIETVEPHFGVRDFFQKNNFVIVDHVLEKGTVFHNHWHDYYEFNLLVNGTIETNYNNSTNITASRGSSSFLSYSDCHSLKFLSDARVINIRFNDKMLSEELNNYFSKNQSVSICKFSEDEIYAIIDLVKEINSEFKNDKTFKELVIKSLIEKIIIMFIRKSTFIDRANDKISIHQVLSIIHEKYLEDINIVTIANQLNVSPSYLGKYFKKNVYVSFNDYLNQQRIGYCCSLLIQTNLTLSKIAQISQYKSLEYFMYVFKKYMKMTPTQYRKMYTEYFDKTEGCDTIDG